MPVHKFYNNISDSESMILVWELTETIDELNKMLSGLNQSEFNNITSEKRKREYLGVRVALKELLGREVDIRYNDEGKPFLANESCHISISHSKEWIAVMAHPTRIPGVDIECPSEKIIKLHTRFLSIEEQEKLPKPIDALQLLITWSAKEALYKMIGKQAVDFANQLHIFPFELQEHGTLMAQHTLSQTVFTLSYIQTSAYTLVYGLA